MYIGTQDDLIQDGDGVPAAEQPDNRCLRCAQQPGGWYVAEIAAPPGRPAERAAIVRDALLGGRRLWLCVGCAEVAAAYGRTLGWRLHAAEHATALPAVGQPGAAEGRVA